jgi:hypothetical protein
VLSASAANGATLVTVATPADPTQENAPIDGTRACQLEQLEQLGHRDIVRDCHVALSLDPTIVQDVAFADPD